jgi:hypothetical protein
MKRTASSQAHRTVKPRTLPLLASERPFLLKPDDLDLTVDGDSDLSPAQTTDTQHRVIF